MSFFSKILSFFKGIWLYQILKFFAIFLLKMRKKWLIWGRSSHLFLDGLELSFLESDLALKYSFMPYTKVLETVHMCICLMWVDFIRKIFQVLIPVFLVFFESTYLYRCKWMRLGRSVWKCGPYIMHEHRGRIRLCLWEWVHLQRHQWNVWR